MVGEDAVGSSSISLLSSTACRDGPTPPANKYRPPSGSRIAFRYSSTYSTRPQAIVKVAHSSRAPSANS